jgi:very-short-patch-repair endonuclease
MPPQWSGEMTPEEATARQQLRDEEKRVAFNDAGYIVIEIWEHEWIKASRNPSYVYELIKQAIRKRTSER